MSYKKQSNFLPGPIPTFTNFNKYPVKNANITSTSASAATTEDTKFFKYIKANPPDSGNMLITYDVDQKNSLLLHKIECVYPANPGAPPKSILAYKINMDSTDSNFTSIANSLGDNQQNNQNNQNNQCMTQPPKPYSNDYMPSCLKICTKLDSSSISKYNYKCTNGTGDEAGGTSGASSPGGVDADSGGSGGSGEYSGGSGDNRGGGGGGGGGDKNGSMGIYLPRGGWLYAGMTQKDLLSQMSKSDYASSIIDSSEPIKTKRINVTTDDGAPIYIVNQKSTNNINTWTKLQDLCIKI